MRRYTLGKRADGASTDLLATQHSRYLTVYRTVSKQADDMMQSLEKVFAQCQGFVHVSWGGGLRPQEPLVNDIDVRILSGYA